MKRLVIALIVVVLATGCGGTAENIVEIPEVPSEDALEVTSINLPEPEKFTVFIEKSDYRLKLYEPAKGSYLGAYILADSGINFDIKSFEELTGKQHALYSYYTDVGSNFPITWILSCIAQSKTPNIVISPMTANLTDSEEDLIKAAKEIGEFYMPMFVQFAPVRIDYEPKEYIAFYQKARNIFKEHASNAAFVWTVDAEDVYDCGKYYPGDSFVDWVGINAYENIMADGKFAGDIYDAIDFFYYTYQRTKPVMLSEFAVSHLSSSDYSYKSGEAAGEIEAAYKKFTEEYPRIKAIVYMDVNELSETSKKPVKENFSLTEEAVVLEAYKKAVAGENYLSVLNVYSTGSFSSERFKSPFAGYKVGKDFFIAKNTIEMDMNINGAAGYLEPKVLNGQEYFNTAKMHINGLGKPIFNDERRVMYLQR